MTLRATLVAVAIAGAWFAAGCRHLPGTEATFERARVDRIELTFASETDGELRAWLTVEPLNDFHGKIDQVQWELWLDGRSFAAGAQTLEAAINPAGETEVSFSAPLHYRNVALSPEPVRMAVGLRGALIARSGEDQLRLPFAGKTVLTLERGPRLETQLED